MVSHFFSILADFSSSPQLVMIRAGTMQSQANISIADDLLVEDTERFTLVLSNPSPIGVISQETATVFITDNDGMNIV